MPVALLVRRCRGLWRTVAGVTSTRNVGGPRLDAAKPTRFEAEKASVLPHAKVLAYVRGSSESPRRHENGVLARADSNPQPKTFAGCAWQSGSPTRHIAAAAVRTVVPTMRPKP